jgi:single-strand DNA-binding protein
MYQKITLVGNLGRDPEMRYTPTGQPVTNLSVATNYTFTNNNGERVKETTWWRVSVWGKQAEACSNYLQSGSKVLVEGRVRPDRETGGPRIYTRQDGSAGSSFDVNASRVVFLSSRGEDQGAYQVSEPGGPESDEDEIPF